MFDKKKLYIYSPEIGAHEIGKLDMAYSFNPHFYDNALEIKLYNSGSIKELCNYVNNIGKKSIKPIRLEILESVSVNNDEQFTHTFRIEDAFLVSIDTIGIEDNYCLTMKFNFKSCVAKS